MDKKELDKHIAVGKLKGLDTLIMFHNTLRRYFIIDIHDTVKYERDTYRSEWYVRACESTKSLGINEEERPYLIGKITHTVHVGSLELYDQ